MMPPHPYQHPENFKRGKRAKRAMKAVKFYVEDKDPNVRDILSDLRHYCDTHHIDFDDEDRVAYDNYVSETHDPCL